MSNTNGYWFFVSIQKMVFYKISSNWQYESKLIQAKWTGGGGNYGLTKHIKQVWAKKKKYK